MLFQTDGILAGENVKNALLFKYIMLKYNSCE